MPDDPTPSDAPEAETAPDDTEPITPPVDAQAIAKAEADAAKEVAAAMRASQRAADEARQALASEHELPDDHPAIKALRKANKEATEHRKEKERIAEQLHALESAANERVLRAEIKVVAAGKIADPADAIALLDLSEFEIGDDGSVDTEAITSAIDALVEAKPYLVGTTRPLGTGGGGARPQTPAPTRDQQISELESAGDIRGAMRLKNQGLVQLMTNNT